MLLVTGQCPKTIYENICLGKTDSIVQLPYQQTILFPNCKYNRLEFIALKVFADYWPSFVQYS